MKHRVAAIEDCLELGKLNYHLIQDEGHRNSMTIAQLEERMDGWLTPGEYRAILFEDDVETVAYALRETDAERLVNITTVLSPPAAPGEEDLTRLADYLKR